jgi:hypothetical protein
VACPYFMPEAPLDAFGRHPLGQAYRGSCHADPAAAIEPPEALQRELCNYGYARGRCDRFPADAVADAVRFSMVEDRLIWVTEREHAPVEHGCEPPPGDELLAAQARVFVETYRRRRNAAANGATTSP